MKNKLRRLEYKLTPYAVKNLMTVMIGAMAIVYIADLLVSSTGKGLSLISWLTFDLSAISAGQFWRIFTFIFLPPEQILFSSFSRFIFTG